MLYINYAQNYSFYSYDKAKKNVLIYFFSLNTLI